MVSRGPQRPHMAPGKPLTLPRSPGKWDVEKILCISVHNFLLLQFIASYGQMLIALDLSIVCSMFVEPIASVKKILNLD